MHQILTVVNPHVGEVAGAQWDTCQFTWRRMKRRSSTRRVVKRGTFLCIILRLSLSRNIAIIIVKMIT